MQITQQDHRDAKAERMMRQRIAARIAERKSQKQAVVIVDGRSWKSDDWFGEDGNAYRAVRNRADHRCGELIGESVVIKLDSRSHVRGVVDMASVASIDKRRDSGKWFASSFRVVVRSPSGATHTAIVTRLPTP